MTSQPRVLVLGGNPIAWKASEQLHLRDTMTGVESWVFAFNGDYMQAKRASANDIARYDIVIGNSGMSEIEHLAELAESRSNGVRWVTLIEGSAHEYLAPVKGLTRLLNASDLVNAINVHSVQLFRSLTKSRVEYIGIPYPSDTIAKRSVNPSDRKREVFLCSPMLHRVTDHAVARRLPDALGVRYYGYEKKLSRTWRNLPNVIRQRSINSQLFIERARAFYDDPRLEIRRMLPLDRYHEANASALVWINLDDRFTWGRYVLDAAALGVPIVTTASTGHGTSLFPATTLASHMDIDAAVQLVSRLIEDKEFYRSVSDISLGYLSNLLHEPMKQRLLASLDD